MEEEYPARYVLRIKALDSINLLVGLSMLATPALLKFYPGAFDTTVHVTLGALLTTCAVFRVLLAYGSAWLEFVTGFLGVLIFFMPSFMHMYYDHPYATGHMVAGAIVIVISLISGISTLLYLKSHPPVAT